MTLDIETEVHRSLVPEAIASIGIEAPPRPPAHARDARAPTVVAVQPLRVLVVDDAGSTRRFIRAVLDHGQDFEVVGEAGDGDGAVERAATLQPDLVLLDLSMPFADGASALREVLRVAPNCKVVIVSGLNPSAGEPLIEAGATAFVPKGIMPFELLERLGDVVREAGEPRRSPHA